MSKEPCRVFFTLQGFFAFCVVPDDNVGTAHTPPGLVQPIPTTERNHLSPLVYPFSAKDFFHYSQEVIDWASGFL
jgi:hypothetical protein